jgi:hypothetical protein
VQVPAAGAGSRCFTSSEPWVRRKGLLATRCLSWAKRLWTPAGAGAPAFTVLALGSRLMVALWAVEAGPGPGSGSFRPAPQPALTWEVDEEVAAMDWVHLDLAGRTLLVVGGARGRVRVWGLGADPRAAKARVVWDLAGPDLRPVACLAAWGAGGRPYVAAAKATAISVWDLSTGGRAFHAPHAHRDGVTSVVWVQGLGRHAQEPALVSAALDGQTKVSRPARWVRPNRAAHASVCCRPGLGRASASEWRADVLGWAENVVLRQVSTSGLFEE